jgi:hypothetical protein
VGVHAVLGTSGGIGGASAYEAAFGPLAATLQSQAVAETVAWFRSRG